jgi:hypothetical protein
MEEFKESKNRKTCASKKAEKSTSSAHVKDTFTWMPKPRHVRAEESFFQVKEISRAGLLNFK